MTYLELHDRLLKKWYTLPLKWRLELISGFYTFATASLLEAGVQWKVYGDALPTETGIIVAILIACLRAGIKALGALLFIQLSAWLAKKKAEQKYE